MKIILGTTMTQKKWDELRGLAKTFLLNGNPHLSLDNEDDHKNGRQLTDHTPDRVHCAADEFPLKQENHEDTIREASSSLQYQVSENPAPAQHNMAPSTCAAPVGPEAPPANVDSTAEGHNDVTGLQSSIEFRDTMKDPANEARPPHQPTCVYNARDLVSPFNCQATMPSHAIDSSSRIGYTSNENFPPPISPRASMSSFSDGHNDVAALPSSVQSQNTYFGNPMKSPAEGSVPLAPRQPIPTDCWSALLYTGYNAITTVDQSRDFNSQSTIPSHVIGSSSQMDYTLNENVPPSEPPNDSILSLRNGKCSKPFIGNFFVRSYTSAYVGPYLLITLMF
ncbi:hypothetical protein EUGRSUZ_A00459 [Eucalyptus grandis]|uniref:Uncharacterized protein n=4 Tax=Eucalyptus grandis TaxID=71139 RepID=A0ACC3M1F8_EUCGR|nr:hypothetical protein EUGRSUZ_A00459 [Eucalyptus grandis]